MRYGYCVNMLAEDTYGVGYAWIPRLAGLGFDYVDLPMAQMMNIPVLGLVENLSYVKCPDCGKEIKVFGESHIEEIAGQFGYDLLGRIPMDPKLSALVDRGMIELMENNYLDDACKTIVEKLGLGTPEA